MSHDAWTAVTRLLDEAAAAGETIRVWLRDDDAVIETPALARLAELCGAASLPILLAVIPAGADESLGAFVGASPHIAPCQHGWQHTNHAAMGQRACEIGGSRPVELVLAELAEGRHKLRCLFGDGLSDVLVPPWNRIDAAIVARLPDLGFTALSTFGPIQQPDGGIPRLNSDVDIIDWRNGRVGRSLSDVDQKLAASMAVARHSRRPVGILTHHLAHDRQAWSVLGDIIGRLDRHPGATFIRPIETLAAQA